MEKKIVGRTEEETFSHDGSSNKAWISLGTCDHTYKFGLIKHIRTKETTNTGLVACSSEESHSLVKIVLVHVSPLLQHRVGKLLPLRIGGWTLSIVLFPPQVNPCPRLIQRRRRTEDFHSWRALSRMTIAGT